MATQQASSTKTGTSVSWPTSLLDEKALTDKVSKMSNWRKNEKGVAKVTGVVITGVLIALGVAFFKYAVPLIMAMISPVVAGIIGFFLVLFAFSMVKPAWRWFRGIARSVHKAIIRWTPWLEIEDKKKLLRAKYEAYKAGKIKVKQAANEFRTRSLQSEQDAESFEEKIREDKEKGGKLRAQRDTLKAQIKEKEPLAKTKKEKEELYQLQDELSSVERAYINAMSAARRNEDSMNKNIEWTKKDAARAKIFTNLDYRLALGMTVMENQIEDFNRWAEDLKKEFESSNAVRNATDLLVQITGPNGTQDWELDYAVDFVTGQISENYSATAQNLEDLNRYIENFDFDSDAAYDHLEKVLAKLDAEEIVIPSSREIMNSTHRLTSEEKRAAGPLGELDLF
ncbi:MAG: hypothetical protein LBD11_02560 [Candidatus Peribacteria bacterium]|jgi:hypothetical protein|nr:hypothetical protein [Candidatus Peribacteria bacterium]